MNWIGLFRFQMVSEIDRLCRLCIEPTSPTNLNHGILCCVQECLNLLLNERKDDFEANSEALKASVKIVSSGLHTNCYIVKLQIFLLCQSVELENINLEPETINNTRWHFYLELIFLFSDHFHFISEEADIQRKNIISILNSSFPLNGLSVWTFLLWNRYWIKRVRCKSHSCHSCQHLFWTETIIPDCLNGIWPTINFRLISTTRMKISGSKAEKKASSWLPNWRTEKAGWTRIELFT